MDKSLKKVVIDPGHGGKDPGTIANGITEKDYNLLISKYISKRLNELNIENKLTRESDDTLDPNERPKKIQSFYGNGSDVVVVSNHINAGGGDGAEIIYSLRNNDKFANAIAKELETTGQNVRKIYQRRLPSNPAKDYYYIMRDTPLNETVIVEYGFADSTGDDVDELKNNWESLAEGVVKAITDYVGGKYIAPIGSNYYTVKLGDSLYSIAKKFKITINELKDANNLQSNLLSVGQNIIIPKKEIKEELITYTVKPGDTLYSIAKKFNISVDKLKDINKLSTNLLSIGEVLNINEGKTDIAEDISKYYVKKGDSLYSIAKKYNTNVDTLKSLNKLNTDVLSIGQILTLPSINNKVTYVVIKGDNLYNIASKFKTTVSAISELNNLSTSNLSIGQTLLIP
ncbi:MAG: LysM peptidoglycan-binding domain-containing protein [Bacilli bacterium]